MHYEDLHYNEAYYNQKEIDDLEEGSTRSNARKVKAFIDSTSEKNAHKIIHNNKKTIVFSSGDIGSYIKNAVTGASYGKKYLVGSKMEDMYFRVGFVVGNEMKKFFFDSPDQYEKHFGCNVEKSVTNGVELRRAWAARAMERQISLVK